MQHEFNQTQGYQIIQHVYKETTISSEKRLTTYHILVPEFSSQPVLTRAQSRRFRQINSLYYVAGTVYLSSISSADQWFVWEYS